MPERMVEERCGMPAAMALLGAASLLMVLGGWGLVCWARAL